MSLNVPTNKVDLRLDRFRRNLPVRSGEHASDIGYGWRGVVSQANHGYAYILHPLHVVAPQYDGTAVFTTTTTASFVPVPEAVTHIGAGFYKLKLRAVIEQAYIQLTIGSNTYESSLQTTKAVKELTAYVFTEDGTSQAINVAIKANTAQTGKLYACTLTPEPLVESDFAPLPTYAELIATTGTAGQLQRVSEGGLYQYSTALSYWIRTEAYALMDADAALIAKIVGNVVPASETPAWTDSATNSGTITSDGTRVTWNATALSTSTATSSITDVLSSGLVRFMQGYVNVSSIGAGDDDDCHVFRAVDGARFVQANLGLVSATNRPRFVTTANASIGTVNRDHTWAGETFVEMLSNPAGDCIMWIGNKAGPYLTCPYGTFSASAALGFRVGDNSTTANANANMTGRLIKCYRLT